MAVECFSFITFRRILFLTVAALWIFASCGQASAKALRVAILRQPESLNMFGATDIWSKKILQFFHMPLLMRGPDGKGRIPWLAESEPVPDGSLNRVVVKLRTAYWDDGSAFTPDDIVFTVKTIQEFQIPGHAERWGMVKDVKALDSKRVQFTLSYPSAVFVNRTLFSGFVKKKDWEPVVESARKSRDPLRGITRYKPKNVASNGPFSMTSCCDPSYMLLKRNPHFFGSGLEVTGMRSGPGLDSIIFKLYKNIPEAAAAIERGDIDFIWSDIPQGEVELWRGKENLEFYRTLRRGYDYMGFHMDRAPLGDIVFRRAVAALLDRDRIISKAMNGDAVKADSVIPPYNTFWYNPRLSWPGDGLPFDKRLELAREILTRAGYSWSDGALVLPNGRKMKSLEILTNCAGSKPCRLKVALLVRKWLKAIGIDATIKMRPLHDMLSNLRKGEFDIYIMGWSHLSNDPGFLETFFHSRGAVPGGKNYPRYRNGTFDSLSERASREIDPALRKGMVFEMQKILAEGIPYFPLYTRHRTEVVRKDIFRGWKVLPGGIGNLWSFMNLTPIN